VETDYLFHHLNNIIDNNTTAIMGQTASVPTRTQPAAVPAQAAVANQSNTAGNFNRAISTSARRACPIARQPQLSARTADSPRRSTTSGKAAYPKRKRRGHGWAKKKSHKPPAPLAHPDNYKFDPYRYYRIQGIMAETKRRYHIRWAGLDSHASGR
jgi:hypothetical protein